MMPGMHKFITKSVDELSNKYYQKKDLLEVVVALLLLRRIYPSQANKPAPIKRNDFINFLWENQSDVYEKFTRTFPELEELCLTRLYSQKQPEILEIADSLLYIHQICKEDLILYIPNEVDAVIFDLLFAKSLPAKDKQCLNIPRQIIKLMVALTEPGTKGSVLDATFNSGYFLVEAYERIQYKLHLNKESVEKDDDGFPLVPNTVENIRLFNSQNLFSLEGVEQDEERYHLGILNFAIRELVNLNYTRTNIFDFFSQKNELYDVVLANPPFGSKKNPHYINLNLRISTRNLDIQFLDVVLHKLKPGARACVIVPEGSLTKTTKDYISFRQLLLENFSLEAVISLPAGAFSPTTNAKASILVISRTDATQRTWFYDLESIGYSLDRNRRRTKGMPLQDCLEEFIRRKETSSDNNDNRGFFVDATTIKTNNLILAVKRYKKPEFTKIETIDPQALLDELTREQREIDENLKTLKELLR